MVRYLTKRVLMILLSLFFIVSLTFFLMHAAPGGPFTSEKKIPPAILHNLQAYYGLNKPLYQQYLSYLGKVAHWDFGPSMTIKGQTVNQIIDRSFPVSLILGLEAVLFAVAVGIFLGCIAALRHNKFADYTAMVIAVIGISVPSFVLAAVLQFVFADKLNWLPVARFASFKYTILPTVALGATPLAFIARLMRSSMLEVLNQDYIKTAKAKGLKQRVITYRHAIRNAIMPVVSYMGPLLSAILTGSFVIEQIFGIPGLGSEFVTSIQNRDYSEIMGVTVFYSVLLLVSILIMDIIYGFIDPRIKITGGRSE